MRKPRAQYQGCLYHVIARGNQRQKIFLSRLDYLKYLKLMKEYLKRHGILVYAYCLMPNHIHLLLEQAEYQPLSRFMQRLQSTYTSYFNRKHKKVGHLFQGRYKAILVERDAYLLELIRYIHLNPFRSKLEDKVGLYPWTGHVEYLGREKEPLGIVEVGKVLAMFGKTLKKARKAYARFISEGTGEGHRRDLYDLRGGQMLGGEDFEIDVNDKAFNQKVEPSLKIKASPGALWQKLKEREGLKDEPTGRRRSYIMAQAAYLAVEGGGQKQKTVADFFHVEPTTINKALKRLTGDWEKNPEEKKALVRWASRL
jgi:putative transposase